MMTNDPKVVDFPNAEERARKLRELVEWRARMSPIEWQLYLSDDAQRHGLEEPALKKMIEAQIKVNEKLEREKRGELREQERKREREEDKAERKREREADKAERREREREREEEQAECREQEEARRARAEGERRGRALEAIVALPTAEHEPELKKLAERRGESLDSLRTTFNMLLAVEKEKIARGEIAPWGKPVNTRALLGELTTQIERYVVIHQKEAATAIVLWTCFAWCHDIATFSPILVIQSGDIEGGKTTASKVISLLTPRARVIAEPTGPSLYRYVDRHHPTLIIDDADRLLAHRPDLAHIVNVSWTRGALIHRTDVKGRTLAFDPFCPKLLNGINLLAHLQPGTRSRCITVNLLPKLAHEKLSACATPLRTKPSSRCSESCFAGLPTICRRSRRQPPRCPRASPTAWKRTSCCSSPSPISLAAAGPKKRARRRSGSPVSTTSRARVSVCSRCCATSSPSTASFLSQINCRSYSLPPMRNGPTIMDA
jgi:hypothetical protein